VPEAVPSQMPRETVRVFAALSDENRFRIVELLATGDELSCGAICSSLGLSPSLLTHHLSILEGAGVLERRKNGLWTLNRLRRDVLAGHLSALDRMLQPSAVPA
jgi:ArsR family transcriptional regulator, arsenate/arsenite/antimonite-responsive transcriptional repressor